MIGPLVRRLGRLGVRLWTPFLLLALGVNKTDAEVILRKWDGNLRRVFTELAARREREPKTVKARSEAGAVKL